MIYFCVPSRDEAATIGLLFWKIRRVLESSAREYQFLVGDDASTDATTEVLASYAKVLPITVLRSEAPQGYAATVERLLKEALRSSDRHKRDVAILMPADFGADPDALPELLRRLDSGADLVVAESTLVGETDPWRVRLRRWAPRLLGRRARVPGVRDIVSGYVAFRLVTLRHAFRERPGPWLTLSGWAANAELLVRAAAGARRIEVVPVEERVERHPRPSRHLPWPRARELWAARRHFRTAAPPTAARERTSRTTAKEVA